MEDVGHPEHIHVADPAGSAFDAVTPAVVAASHTVNSLLNPSRAARMVETVAVQLAESGPCSVSELTEARGVFARLSALFVETRAIGPESSCGAWQIVVIKSVCRRMSIDMFRSGIVSVSLVR